MACGRPVIAWAKQTPWYDEQPPAVRAVDGPDIARAIVRLVDDPALRGSVGAASRAWIVANHGLDAVAARVEAVAAEALAELRGEGTPE
jgi:glycosyltransferase involved in cell wall biosynthesis